MKTISTFTFCILTLFSIGQSQRISIGPDYKISTSGVSVLSKTTPINQRNVEGQRSQSIFIADSVRYYDENLESIDSNVYFEKTKSGEFLSVISFDQTRSILTYLMRKTPKPENEWLDKPVPRINFIDINGERWDNSSIKGKTVVFYFWFTKCGACINEIPLLNHLKDQNPNVSWFAITYEDPLTVQSFLKSHKLNLNIIPGQQDLINQLNIKLFPRTMIIDETATIKDILYGAFQDSTLLQEKINFYYDH